MSITKDRVAELSEALGVQTVFRDDGMGVVYFEGQCFTSGRYAQIWSTLSFILNMREELERAIHEGN